MVSRQELFKYQINQEKRKRRKRNRNLPTYLFLDTAVTAISALQYGLNTLTKRSFNFLQTLMLAVFFLLGLFAISVIALSPSAQTTDIFPTACEGDGQTGDNVFTRELEDKASFAVFILRYS